MQLDRARIKNFRSLRDVEVAFGAHTAFIGGNGAGKSSILKAIEKFYSTSKNCEADDYFGRDQGQLLLNGMDAAEHVEKLSRDDMRRILKEVAEVLGELLKRDIPVDRRADD